MISLVGICLISIGLNIKLNIYNDYKILSNKMINEKVFVYPYDTNQFVKKVSLNKNSINDNMIVKIPNNYIYKKYSIGKIKIQKITKKTSTVINYDKVNDFIKIENKETKCRETFLEHLLFPTCKFKEFEFDNKRFYDNKIKILFDNTIISKSNCNLPLINKYKNIVENNCISLNTSGCDFELEENFIGNFDDLYLMVEPCLMSTYQESSQEPSQQPSQESSQEPSQEPSQESSQESSQEPKVKFNIIALSDNKDKIIKEKYIDELNEINHKMFLSYFSIISGVVVLLFIKN